MVFPSDSGSENSAKTKSYLDREFQPEKNPKMDTTKQIAIAIKQLLFFNDSPCVILTVSTKISNKTGYKSSHSY